MNRCGNPAIHLSSSIESFSNALLDKLVLHSPASVQNPLKGHSAGTEKWHGLGYAAIYCIWRFKLNLEC